MKIFSIAKILEIAGGPAGLRDMMGAAGQDTPPSSNLISLWNFRGRLPGKWAGAVIYTLAVEANTNPLDLLVDIEMTDEELDEDDLGIPA